MLTQEQIAHPKLMFVDVEEQLPKFMINDWPSELRFRRVIDGMLGQELWNKLVEEYSFTLLCAYPVAKMSQENDHESVCATSRFHAHVHTQSGDTIPLR